MGNKTVAPEKSHAPIHPTTWTHPRPNVPIFEPDGHFNAHTRSPTSPIPFNSPTFAFPLDSADENIYNIPPLPTTSPTFAFPVHSPTTAIPIEHPITPDPIEPSTAAIPVNSPTSEIPIVSSSTEVPVKPLSPRVFVISPIPRTPIFSPSTPFSANSPTSKIPVTSPVPAISTVSPSAVVSTISPTSKIPVTYPAPVVSTFSPRTVVPVNSPIAAPVASSSPDIPIPSPISNIYGFPVLSPDTSAVSPTLDLFNTPIASPVPEEVVIPAKPPSFSNKSRSAARITHDASTSPMVRVVSTTHIIPIPSRPTEAARKRTILKNSIPPPRPIIKQIKPSTLSSADRSNKWKQFEQKQQEKEKRFVDSPQQTQNSFKRSISSPRISSPDLKITPVSPNIIAVPSFSLRSTAVSNPSQDPQILSERTQSIHTDFSIFKYYLTYNEAKHSIGDHTKATMFQMDTRLKQTPLPAPSLTFLKRNFNDGTRGIKDNSVLIAPSFGSLGLEHDFENEPDDQYPTEPRLHDKQQQRKLYQTSLFPDYASDSNNSLQFVTSTVMSPADFLPVEQTSIPNNRQPLTSILKKPSTQFNIGSLPTKTNYNILQEFQKNDFDNNPSTVSFKLPSPSLRTKASQSISRSVKLTHRKQ